jgi:hypothetical protein
MPVPMPEQLDELIAAYDLNPLIKLKLLHKQKICFCEGYVKPKANKKHTAEVAYESIVLNLAVRDTVNIDKLRVIKVVHAIMHRKVFIFYLKPQILRNIFEMLTSVFDFNRVTNH